MGNSWDGAEYTYIGLIINEYIINDISNDANIIIAIIIGDKSNK
jgi:hypothetical protein